MLQGYVGVLLDWVVISNMALGMSVFNATWLELNGRSWIGVNFVPELSEYDSNGYPITWGLPPNRGYIRARQ